MTNLDQPISQIVGKTPTSITVKDYSEELHFVFSDGTSCKFYHQRDCCETVRIEDISGDLEDLIGVPLLVAEERSETGEYKACESWTATFYTFRSIKGTVDVRWLGESNGYYSESVDFLMSDGGGDGA